MLLYKIHLNDSVGVYDDMKYQRSISKKTGGKQILAQGKIGMELHRKTNTWQYRLRQIDNQDASKPASYREQIINHETGFNKNTVQRLIDHKNYGSAKKRIDKCVENI